MWVTTVRPRPNELIASHAWFPNFLRLISLMMSEARTQNSRSGSSDSGSFQSKIEGQRALVMTVSTNKETFTSMDASELDNVARTPVNVCVSCQNPTSSSHTIVLTVNDKRSNSAVRICNSFRTNRCFITLLQTHAGCDSNLLMRSVNAASERLPMRPDCSFRACSAMSI